MKLPCDTNNNKYFPNIVLKQFSGRFKKKSQIIIQNNFRMKCRQNNRMLKKILKYLTKDILKTFLKELSNNSEHILSQELLKYSSENSKLFDKLSKKINKCLII